MKSNSTIYLFSNFPVFNKEGLPEFESFGKEDSCLFYSSLVTNYIEVFENISGSVNVVYCFDNMDRDFLPDELKGENTLLFFGDTSDKPGMFETLSEKYFNKTDNNIIILSNSIGITAADINKAFNLLQIEDEIFVIGKSVNNKSAFVGFNSFNTELFSCLNWDDPDYDYFLAQVNKHENFVHVLDNFMLISSIADFKNLYIELSKKESLAYCSQNMHEKFTHLFIEYKDLLK